MSSSVGFRFSSNNALALITMPGVQKPHCTAPASANAFEYISLSNSLSPSIVSTSLSCSLSTFIVQDLTALPSIKTVQLPHTPTSQPFLTDVSFSTSRRYFKRVVTFCTDTALPFSLKFTKDTTYLSKMISI